MWLCIPADRCREKQFLPPSAADPSTVLRTIVRPLFCSRKRIQKIRDPHESRETKSLFWGRRRARLRRWCREKYVLRCPSVPPTTLSSPSSARPVSRTIWTWRSLIAKSWAWSMTIEALVSAFNRIVTCPLRLQTDELYIRLVAMGSSPPIAMITSNPGPWFWSRNPYGESNLPPCYPLLPPQENGKNALKTL